MRGVPVVSAGCPGFVHDCATELGPPPRTSRNMLNQNHGTRLQSTDALEAAEFKQPLVTAISSSAMRLVSTAPGLRSSGQRIKACSPSRRSFASCPPGATLHRSDGPTRRVGRPKLACRWHTRLHIRTEFEHVAYSCRCAILKDILAAMTRDLSFIGPSGCQATRCL